MAVDEDVLSGALRDMSDGVQHDCLVGSLGDGFPLGKGGCDIRSVDLGSGRSAKVVGPLPGGSDELGSGVGSGSEVGSHVDAGDGEGDRHMDGVQADFLSAEEDAGLDIVDCRSVGPDGVLDRLEDVLLGVGLAVEDEVESHHLASVDKPPDVVLEPEHGRPLGSLIDPDSLEDAGAVIERMGENVDLGVLPVDKLSVEPNLLCLIHLFTLLDS